MNPAGDPFLRRHSLPGYIGRLYCHGLSMNTIAKMLHASPSTILDWIRNFGSEHAKPPEPQETGAVVLELDEMWHYLKKKAETLVLESFVS